MLIQAAVPYQDEDDVMKPLLHDKDNVNPELLVDFNELKMDEKVLGRGYRIF